MTFIYICLLMIMSIINRKMVYIYNIIATMLYSVITVKLGLTWFGNTDEILTVITCFYIIKDIIFIQKVTKRELKVFSAIILYAILGGVGNIYSNINIDTAMSGGLLILKTYILYIGYSRVRWSKQDLNLIYLILQKMMVIILILGYIFYFIPRLALFESEYMVSIFDSPGIFATYITIASIAAIILYLEKKEKKYLVFSFFSIISIVLAWRVKSIISFIICFILYFIKTKGIKRSLVFLISFMFISLTVLLIFGFDNYLFQAFTVRFEQYFKNSNWLNVPRWALYYYGFRIAIDYFPFGSGFSTYGSHLSFTNYSDIYRIYNLDSRNGFTYNGSYSFVTDTYWPAIMGESGFIGCIIIIYILYYIYKNSKLIVNNFNDYSVNVFSKISYYAVLLCIIESFFTSNLMNFRCYLSIFISAIMYGYYKNEKIGGIK